MDRREFVRNAASGTAAAVLLSPSLLSSPESAGSRIACQQYTLATFLAREGYRWGEDHPANLAHLKAAGFTGFEPTLESASDAAALAAALKNAGMWAKSFYVNSELHEKDLAEVSMAKVMDIARAARAFGAEIAITNPTPIRWGGPENKSDQQLAWQARVLDKLGSRLRAEGMKLAYHNHDAEMREGAREFHHMMVATDPDNVHLCLDPHWIYRGAGNSQIALFDIIKLYGSRVVEIHLRQSSGGVWTERFGEGDIDYPAMAAAFNSTGLRPLLVMEQAPEQGTAQTMKTADALRQSLEYAGRIFRGWN
jgi:inosose dehydratase